MICLDANFRLKRYGRNNEIIDPPLGDGYAYNVTTGPYHTYLQRFGNQKEVTCLFIYFFLLCLS